MNPYTQHLPLPLVREIDILLDEFEQAWGARQAPRIEDFLARVPAEAARPLALRSFLLLDMDLRRKSGESIEFDEYLRRFPSAGVEVEAAFEHVRQSEADARSIADTQTGGPHSLSGTEDPARAPRQTAPETDLPEYIGRYRVQKQLGIGGFGIVYLADDPDLKRSVALKLPRADRDWTDEELDRFLEEARTAVRLTHDGIVRVHDVFRDGERVAVVQEYIAGRDLAAEIEGRALHPERCVELMLIVCESLAFAHQRGFVHRDLKPGNILLDDKGRPRIADFGLAVHESLQRRRRGEQSGTPPYMSPEQVRGETHRLDGRSDIWSLGIILYEILTGRKPFSGESLDELFDEIKYRDPRPLRQINPQLPAELERICLKCLAKRATDRYSSAVDLADDLRQWRAGDPKPKTATPVIVEKHKVVPKGLRSFGEEDADFFLDLLPGPRGRDGLPESIRFWKSRIEETDPDKTFSVGLIYGPSGCGKSSLMKAGLLPRLASHVLPIYVEATPVDTETRLLKGLRKICPDIPGDAALPELFESLRAGQWLPRGKKLTIVLDQFEQWLHAHRGEEETQLVQALRHCDGARVQCVLMIHDDFWMAITRFFRELDIRLIEAHNSAATDLFPLPHAEKFLSAIGCAFSALPENIDECTSDHREFIRRSVDELAQEGKVICVRLALFAQMMQGKSWVPASLEQAGGTEGVGFAFLEETFSASTAPPEHRLHQKAARAVLKAMLPESGTNIKGGMRSYDELLQASDYARRPKDFEQLIRILDTELRLITPTEPAGHAVDDEKLEEPQRPADLSSSDLRPPLSLLPPPDSRLRSPDSGLLFYQLTHDYLVPSLREWLTRKQKETRRGRAELRLAERAALWNAKPENQQLPAWWEDLSIRWLTDHKKWTEPQQRMMRRSGRFHLLRTVALAVVVLLVGWGAYEIHGSYKANALLAALDGAKEDVVPGKVDELSRYFRWARGGLRDRIGINPGNDAERRIQLHARLATVSRDPSLVEPLAEELLTGKVTYVLPIRQLLRPYAGQLIDRFLGVLRDERADSRRRFRAALALADFLPPSDTAKWRERDLKLVAEQLVSSNAEFQQLLREALRPIRRRLLGDLERVFADPQSTDAQRLGAANAFADFAGDDVAKLTQLLAVATPDQYAVLYPIVAANPSRASI